ncbi:MAG: exodeoxyribonuclease III [Rickettsiales bacterium]|nr:exodeoxyribonuclease III [Rickettsiales bacterium]
MLLASWNINSVRIRLGILDLWIKKRNPEIFFLQEIKCEAIDFPYNFFKKLGYESYVFGQKGRNGVAIIVKKNIIEKEDTINIDNLNIEGQARFIEYYSKKLEIYFCNIYAPNGNPLSNHEKFNFKVKWYDNLKEYLSKHIKNEKKIIIAGDFNVLENEKDVKDFDNWSEDALGKLIIRKKFRKILGLGFTNIVRQYYEPGKIFSFWDYQKAAWQRNYGLLIDHILCSPNLLESIISFGSDHEMRGKERPSDHIPIWMEFN